MKKEDALKELKVMFYNEVGLHIEDAKKIEDEKNKLQMISILLEYLQSPDLLDWYDDRFFISAGLELAFDEVKAKMLYDKFCQLIFSNIDNQGRLTNEPEYYVQAQESFYDLINEEFSNQEAKVNIAQRRYHEKSDDVRTYKTIHSSLKNGVYLNTYYFKFIHEYMRANGFEPEKQILVNEALLAHNRQCSKKGSEVSPTNVEKMLNSRLRKFPIAEEAETAYKNSFDSTIRGIVHAIDHVSDDDTQEILDELSEYSEAFSKEECDYIFTSVLNGLLDIILDSIEQVRDLASYYDSAMRNAAIQTYYETLSKYYTVFKHFKTLSTKNGEEFALSDIEDNDIQEKTEEEYVNTIVYLTNGDQAFAERDLKKLPKEYYEKVKELIEGKKRGTLSSRKDTIMKANNDTLAGFGKLKDDQVRIVYRPLGNNVYLIIGLFDKRDTADLVGYKAMAKRYGNYRIPPVEQLIAEAPEVESSFFQKLDSEGRKADR